MPVGIAVGGRRRFQCCQKRCPWVIVLLAVFLVTKPGAAACGELPLWELGVGVFPSTYPAYRGSDDQQYYLLPIPFLAYRGEILKIDREGMRAQLFGTDRLEINISVNGAIPVKSDKSGARSGMPDLDPTIEIGPSLNVVIARSSRNHTLKLKFPVRSVIATDFDSSEQAGWIFNPHLNWDAEDVFGGWNSALSIGPLFGNKEYHSYYYDVDAQLATASRSAYSASGGYSGTLVLGTMSRHFDHIWVGGFIRYDNLSGVAFDDSPLFETEHSLMGGFAVAWILKKSSRTVER